MAAMDPKVLQGVFEEALTASSTDAHVTFKPMFGGILAYADGKPLASLFDGGIGLKLGASDQEELLKIKGAKRLKYEVDSAPSKTYIVVPESFHKDRKTFAGWIERSIGFVRAPGGKKKR